MLERLVHYAPVTARGILMGAADIVPGVSGGTIAFITGIYETLIDSIKSVNAMALRKLLRLEFREFWRHINGGFLFSLLTGIVISILTLASAIVYLLEHHQMLLFSFFFGLITASAISVAARIHSHSLTAYLSGLSGILLALIVTSLSPVSTPETWWFVFLSGVIAITAMILPGISGSFILLLLGKYSFIMNSIKELNFAVIVIFAAGCTVGITGFSRVLSRLLHRYHDQTILMLAGFMLGSLGKVWPWKAGTPSGIEGDKAILFSTNVLPDTYLVMTSNDPQTVPAVLLMIAGLVLVAALEYTAGSKQQTYTNPHSK
ncbi:DUF368 domain-containing protein [Prosthecochloris sp. HL-130-GSB]|jgi:putative membrane protein|uniref:DUF368 domain-containing protein n=1 Tax=Prosthecochloris aestuarii TaxID=1102 RepID=A0A831WV19_PROAE|nr:DUF368 domain-containing protein [Prosthecochloris sp. HL-130-GSB]ARM31254.1 DUF368 domain-containing protein [Prosthecochloris sp. HL-130-GSB]MBO8092462.1 DUF368 domain-containing protein [Prosthecochloris sp.]HED30774.1 DUF368 domain-containing protein [Prosthecochloris aestuarii]